MCVVCVCHVYLRLRLIDAQSVDRRLEASVQLRRPHKPLLLRTPPSRIDIDHTHGMAARRRCRRGRRVLRRRHRHRHAARRARPAAGTLLRLRTRRARVAQRVGKSRKIR